MMAKQRVQHVQLVTQVAIVKGLIYTIHFAGCAVTYSLV